jgi:Domain of unknown function (DUF4189)/TIR domain
MPRIIVSYRRSDAAAMSGRIFDRLIARYGKDAVFMDVDNIPFGIDFRQHISDALQEIDILVVVIGPRWIGADANGHIRIKDPNDPVRIEVETALRRDIPVVPVLVDGASIPGSAELPESLGELSYRNAAEVDTGRDFHPHMDRLIRSLDRILEDATRRLGHRMLGRHKPRQRRIVLAISIIGIICVGLVVGATWYAIEKFLVANNRASAPIRPSASAVTPSAPKTAQNAFDIAKNIGTVQAWDDFIAKAESGEYQAGTLADEARRERAKLAGAERAQTAFDQAKKIGTVQAWDDFITKVDSGEYQPGALADEARRERAKLAGAERAQTAFDQAKKIGTVQAWEDFIAKAESGEYQAGALADEARRERAKLASAERAQTAFDQAKKIGTVQAWDDFIARAGSGEYQAGAPADEARRERAKLAGAERTQTAFDQAKKIGTVQAWDDFITKAESGEYQAGTLADEARRERAKLAGAERAQTPNVWGAIVFDKRTGKRWGMVWDQPTREAAMKAAGSYCAATQCEAEYAFSGKECAALAVSSTSWSIKPADEIQKARQAALEDCGKRGSVCRIIAASCADGSEKFSVAR